MIPATLRQLLSPAATIAILLHSGHGLLHGWDLLKAASCFNLCLISQSRRNVRGGGLVGAVSIALCVKQRDRLTLRLRLVSARLAGRVL